MQDQLYDIYDLWYQPWYQNKWYLFLAAIGGLTVLGLLIFAIRFFWPSKKRNKTWQDELYELLELAESIKSVDLKKSYFFLTHAVRLYISKKYGHSVMHLTDLQIQNVLERSVKEQYTKGLKDIFIHGFERKFQILEQTDRQKQDDTALFDRDIEYVRGFIRDTVDQDDTEV